MPEDWTARWVAFAERPDEDLGIYVLRCKLNLSEPPEHLEIKLSADQRYKLFVGSALVSFGPQRGDLEHWYYDTVDLGPLLTPGENVVWALVWNFGSQAPMAQITLRTGFLCESSEATLCTPGDWQMARVPGWDYGRISETALDFTGPDESIDGRAVQDWRRLPFDDGLDWRSPRAIRQAASRGARFEPWWSLIPRSIPPMRYEVRRADGRSTFDVRRATPSKAGTPTPYPLTLTPGAEGRLLLDYGELLCAYPRLMLEGAPGTEVTITYAEALWLPEGGKGNRNEVEGKVMRGPQDRVILGDGPTYFEPLWWRTYRYLQIETGDEGGPTGDAEKQTRTSDPAIPNPHESPGDPATQSPGPASRVPCPVSVLAIDAVETGYAYTVESSFEADDPSVKPLWDVSVRTARRCAGETYFDCPYYEQLQYVGDTRIQALIHYYLSTDRALARNAVEEFGWSIMSNGLTQSRYPNRATQVIPPFSLWWVLMLHDQMLYDRLPIDENEDALRKRQRFGIVEAFDALREEEAQGSGAFWNFGDWVPEWEAGVPPGSTSSTVHRLTYRLAQMSGFRPVVEEKVGKAASIPEEAAEYARATAWRKFSHEFVVEEGLIRSLKDPTNERSEHAEALWRVGQLFAGEPVAPWPAEALERAGAAKCTYYFSYYKHLAMAAAALAEGAAEGAVLSGRPNRPAPFDYLAELAPWKEMIEAGLSTFAENPEPARSDCHAWSAHPALGFFQFVAGVTSVEPGWRRASICPQPGSLRRFDARIAHPDGELRVRYEDGGLEVDTPVPAVLRWRGKEDELAPGRHRL